MESSVWTRAVACALLLSIACGAEIHDPDEEVDLDARALRDFYPKDPNLTNEKELLGALQEVLEKLQSKRISLWEKKFGRVPTVSGTIPEELRLFRREEPSRTINHFKKIQGS
uniref:Cocaine- and amphetamine-regulated transcript protein n=1 Tax=Pygocentrus nattereri TaxID=42514 RepID=A0AAR2IJX2_PYGNA